ncbi:hypothetical protein GCM10009716_44490 [Streptomyces sodiiphilus]|uniref:Uncharacterized protein n=1 Tax=Streptomyces sodiiphilus TaxID=226217 RepID=A0ABN2PXC4_9ACTN
MRTRKRSTAPLGTAGPPARADSRGPRTSGPRLPVRFDRQRPQRWFAEQFVLVLSGRRPVHSLLGHVRAPAYEQLCGLAPLAPLRPSGIDRGEPSLRGVGSCRPRRGVIEAFARVSTGGRVRAMAFRLEAGRDGRWQCCAIELDTGR